MAQKERRLAEPFDEPPQASYQLYAPPSPAQQAGSTDCQ
jgi:hypothetical protein